MFVARRPYPPVAININLDEELAAAEAAAAAAAAAALANTPVCNDTTAPTVSVRFDVSPKTYLTEFRAIVAFSEPVLGFDAASNVTAGPFTLRFTSS